MEAQEAMTLRGRPVVGFGEALTPPIAGATSLWTTTIVTSVVGAVAGYAAEELARTVYKKAIR